VLLVGFLALWETATRRGWVDPFFVSQPSTLAIQIFDWLRSGFIFRHLLVTIEETILGVLVGTALVLAPLFILWFGLGLLSKVVMVVSLVFFVVFFSTDTGLREVDRDLVNNARILGASPRHMIRHVLLPAASTTTSSC
jgi:NitT/TauT family transport system permease protein